ncbi:MAG: hypothetical protein C0518_00375 [Opitutus sp.]|nr:hypothetical protein [Opitutus sp.]
MKVRILRSALEDLAAARKFYDRQSLTAGSSFFENLFAELDSLEHHAGIHRVCFGYHRLLARRFPSAIYYRISGQEVIVHRVLDCRRDPRWTYRQLKD